MDIKDVTKKVRQLEISTSRQINELFIGNYKSVFRGQGLEVSDLRKYEDGDDVRHIDWITSAKQGSVYVKKYQETRELTTILIIDLSASMNFSTTTKTKKEIVLEFAAIIMFSSLKNSDKFGAILYNEDFFLYIKPKKGKVQLLKILKEIIVGFDNNSYKKSNQKKALNFLNDTIKRHAICFFISDYINTNQKNNSLLKIANKKYDFIFVNVFDDFEKKINFSGTLKIENPENGAIKIIDLRNKKIRDSYYQIRTEKYRKIKEVLRKNKIDDIEISTTSNIYKEMLKFFKKRKKGYKY